ncbi:MAG TPA: transcription-repair coupling factor, partial [Actinotalea sp.]|nr:transcription-repair coupling factor [Actinotalea sp.]
MNLTGLLPVLLGDPAAARLAASALAPVPSAREAQVDVVAPAGARPALLAGLLGQGTASVEDAADTGATAPAGAADLAGTGRPPGLVVAVVATGREADDLAAALRCYLPPDATDAVAVLPAWETLPHERLSPRSDTVARRLAVMRRLAHPEPGGPAGPVRALVVPVRALLQPVVEGLGELVPVALRAGDTADLERVAADLVAAAYSRVDMVERRGEFAVRGGILDVFAPTEDHPQRIEFWGDQVEEIRWFAVADQRSLEIAADGLWAPPCREMLLTEPVRSRAAALVEQLPGAAEMLEKMSQGIAVEGMESLAPVLVDRMVPVLDLLPDALVVVVDPERVRRRAHDLQATTQEFLEAAWTSAAAGGSTPIDLRAASFATYGQAREHALSLRQGWWTLSGFTLAAADAATDAASAGDGDAGRPAADGSLVLD